MQNRTCFSAAKEQVEIFLLVALRFLAPAIKGGYSLKANPGIPLVSSVSKRSMTENVELKVCGRG